MEIKIPEELEAYMAQEIAAKPGMDRRGFVLDAIRQHCARCEGNRKRAIAQRQKRYFTTSTPDAIDTTSQY